jgi:hypothetical protein
MKRKKTGGKDFKPGQSGNANGRPKLDPMVKQLKRFTADQLEELVSSLLTSTEADVVAMREDTGAPYIKRIMAQILEKTFEGGNIGALDMVLNRLIGKVKERVDVHTFKPSILERRDGTQVEFTNKQIKEDE